MVSQYEFVGDPLEEVVGAEVCRASSYLCQLETPEATGVSARALELIVAITSRTPTLQDFPGILPGFVNLWRLCSAYVVTGHLRGPHPMYKDPMQLPSYGIVTSSWESLDK
ncbi:hypothetical protein Hamer_G013846, partial [Homarus americanus]